MNVVNTINQSINQTKAHTRSHPPTHPCHREQSPGGPHGGRVCVLVTQVHDFPYAALDDCLRALVTRKETNINLVS